MSGMVIIFPPAGIAYFPMIGEDKGRKEVNFTGHQLIDFGDSPRCIRA
jgi:hypothetical protein